MSTGLVVGLAAAAALVATVKIAAALSPVSGVYAPYLEVVAALAMVGGGAAALAVRSPRARIAFLAAGQTGWVLAGLVDALPRRDRRRRLPAGRVRDRGHGWSGR